MSQNLIVQASFKLSVLLPPPAECWDYRREPPYRHNVFLNYPAG